VVGSCGGIYWRLMNTFTVGASLIFACVWCHIERLSPYTLHSCIIAGAELHLVLHSSIYVAELF
jgi:hypothetical protein